MSWRSKRAALAKANLASPAQLTWQRFCKNRLAVASLIVICVLVLLSAFAPVLSPYDYAAQDLSSVRAAPSAEHLLGTDELGRDVWTRLLYGGRVSIVIGLAAMGIQLVIGVTMGVIAGFFGGKVDSVIMTVIDIIMCFPFFVIALSLAAIMGAGITNIILIIGFLTWPHIARIVRAQVLSLKERDYIEAARALGLKAPSILWHHVLPNVASPIIVAATLAVAEGILSEASLSFLGLGVIPPDPSWGNMLVAAQNISALQFEWWRWAPAGLAVVLMVLSINFLGDGLRNALDPSSGRRA